MRPYTDMTLFTCGLRTALMALLGLGIALVSPGAFATYATLEIAGFEKQIVGTTAVITGSGSKNNTESWNFSDSARFFLNGDDGSPNKNPVTFGLDVRPVATSGAFQPDTDSLMIAQTVNSQGLTDTGSLSLYISPSNGDWTGTFRFSFYAGANGTSDFTTPSRVSAEVTSLDLDFDQRMVLYRSELAGYALNVPTDVVVTEPSSDLIQFQGLGNAQFNDPEAAVVALYNNAREFNIMFAHDSVALFMFEFRNPPSDLDDANLEFTSTAPAPSTALLLAPALFLVPALRRRFASERDQMRRTGLSARIQ